MLLQGGLQRGPASPLNSAPNVLACGQVVKRSPECQLGTVQCPAGWTHEERVPGSEE